MSVKKINIILFGIEETGSSLITEVLSNQESLLENNNLDLRLPVITNSTVAFFEKPTVRNSWEANFIQFAVPFKIADIINFVQENELENLIAVDTSNTEDILPDYFDLLQNDFDIISANPLVQAFSADFKMALNNSIKKTEKDFVFVNPNEKRLSPKLLEQILKIAAKQNFRIAV
jgi:homoserine dehydrogenase